jgi:hypothetical protein
MSRFLGTSLLVFVALSCSAQLQIPLSGSPSTGGSHKNQRITTRILTGTVLDKSDKPIPDAVVYLTNSKTLAMKTYITQNDGSYRFPELSPNVDYDVYAQREGKKSSTKTLSQFDDRPQPNINLQIDLNSKTPKS